MSSLPIDQVLPDLIGALQRHPTVILQAPPGAGKTTRVPLALLHDRDMAGLRILMLEPRRLAAANAARWMAALLGEDVGQTVGYRIRFESRVSGKTRIEVVTEGILTRMMQRDPELSGVGVVIFDEFHERNLQADLALALCRDIQSGLRDNLKIIVMSATVDTASLAMKLGNVPVIGCAGKIFPVHICYQPPKTEMSPELAAAQLIPRALAESDGDILVFLPGAGEIIRCQNILRASLNSDNYLICPLYGDLPFVDQERAIQPVPGRRKIVLATNIAETSLTINGVNTVIDSGWCRRLRFDPSTGLNRLVLERISQASATQRAGRGGRLGPGICYRLWSEHLQRSLIPYEAAEIAAADLASLVLELALWGVKDADALSWIDPPPSAAFGVARGLLLRLEAITPDGNITPLGAKMAALPVHPRLAHLLLGAHAQRFGSLGCELAALLSERDIFRSGDYAKARHAAASDLLDRVEAFRAWRQSGSGDSPFGAVDVVACRIVERTSGQLRRMIGAGEDTGEPSAEIVGILLASAYPDRVARQREPGGARYLLANGRGAVLADQSVVRNESFIVAVNVAAGEGAEDRIRLASALSLAGVRHLFASSITRSRVVGWDEREGRVVSREEERLDQLLLETRFVAPTREEARDALIAGISAGSAGLSALKWTPQVIQFVARIRFLRRTFPGEWPDFPDENLLATLGEWLGPYLDNVKNLADLGKIDVTAPLHDLLTRENRRKLEAGAPQHIVVPSGSQIRIDYLPEDGPILAVKLQELFGLDDTPTVAWGRVQLVLHLLSPAGRPVQVTRDLKNFWNHGYPVVKRELKGRYPKHPWPDDPWSAVPTKFTGRKAQR